MCECKIKSKTPAGTLGNFNYVFECKSSTGVIKEISVTSGNDNTAMLLAELECSEDKITPAAEAVIETYIDSTTVKTSNSVAEIKVRHKINTGAALGTVYTEVTSGGEGDCSVGVVMGKWSAWTLLMNHAGVVNISLKNKYPNDIGVISEIKYFK